MAKFFEFDWIQPADHPDKFLTLDSLISPTAILLGISKLPFTFVEDRGYGLITTRDRLHCLEVTDTTDPALPAARLTRIISAPSPIISGNPLPSGVTDAMRFSVNYEDEGKFQIKSKKYSDLESPKEIVLDLYTGNINPGTKIVAHPDFEDNRFNQRWLFGRSDKDGSTANVFNLGWIQLKDQTDRFINLNSSSSPTSIVIGTNEEVFNFVIQPATYGAYGLLASRDLKHVVQVTNNIDSTTPAARLTAVVPAPATIVSGRPLPSCIEESMLFSINYKNGMFQIKNKKYSDLEKPKEIVLDLERGDTTPNTKIVAHPDFGDDRINQRWTFKTQLGTDKIVKFATKSGSTPPPGAVTIDFVSPQEDYVPDVSPNIIDGEWIAVNLGTFGMLTAGKADPVDPSKTCYEFTMNEVRDPKFKKDRNELCHCFARLSNIPSSISQAEALQTCKYAYSNAPTPSAYCQQGAHMTYTFQLYVPPWTGDKTKVNVIFAQWHGMPNSLLFKIPDGSGYRVEGPLSPTAALSVWSRYGFKNGISSSTPYNYVEQGGKPPLAVKFKDNKLQVVCTGDSRWFSDKYVPGTDNKWKPSPSDPHYKTQVLYDAMSLDTFPTNEWVTFAIDVKWAEFTAGRDEMKSPGTLKIDMTHSHGTTKIVDSNNLFIGRNDTLGYYFKFGCYRHSTEAVNFFVKGYGQNVVP